MHGCLTTPGLGKDTGVTNDIPYPELQITRSDTRYPKCTVNLVIANGHFNLSTEVFVEIVHVFVTLT